MFSLLKNGVSHPFLHYSPPDGPFNIFESAAEQQHLFFFSCFPFSFFFLFCLVTLRLCPALVHLYFNFFFLYSSISLYFLSFTRYYAAIVHAPFHRGTNRSITPSGNRVAKTTSCNSETIHEVVSSTLHVQAKSVD